MRGEPRFWDVEDRLARRSDLGDQLEAFARVVDFEMFRPELEVAWTPFSAFANFTGQPAASVPAGQTCDGRPVGLQIVGRTSTILAPVR